MIIISLKSNLYRINAKSIITQSNSLLHLIQNFYGSQKKMDFIYFITPNYTSF